MGETQVPEPQSGTSTQALWSEMWAAGAPRLPRPCMWSSSPSLTADTSDSPCACRPWTSPQAAQPLALPAPFSTYLSERQSDRCTREPTPTGSLPSGHDAQLGQAEAGAGTQGPSHPGTAAAPGVCMCRSGGACDTSVACHGTTRAPFPDALSGQVALGPAVPGLEATGVAGAGRQPGRMPVRGGPRWVPRGPV